MKFAVAGSSGFIGKHLTLFLTKQGASVLEIGALEDLETHRVDHVFHLAAKTSIPNSWQTPETYIETNVLGTLTVLKQAQRMGASLTYVSTSFPNKIPSHPYGLSKYFAEELCAFYAHHFDIPITILRLANVYGPYQKDSFLIPFVLAQVLDPALSEITVKDLAPERDFIFIDDVVEALYQTVSPKPGLRIWHVGTECYTSVEEVIQMSLRISGVEKSYRELQETRKGEVSYPKMDCQDTYRQTGWCPHVPLEEGLRRMIVASKEKA